MLSVALHDSPGAGTAVPTQRAHAVERQWHTPEGFWHSGLNNRANSGLWLQNIISGPPCARGRAGCTPAACTGPCLSTTSCTASPAAQAQLQHRDAFHPYPLQFWNGWKHGCVCPSTKRRRTACCCCLRHSFGGGRALRQWLPRHAVALPHPTHTPVEGPAPPRTSPTSVKVLEQLPLWKWGTAKVELIPENTQCYR